MTTTTAGYAPPSRRDDVNRLDRCATRLLDASRTRPAPGSGELTFATSTPHLSEELIPLNLGTSTEACEAERRFAAHTMRGVATSGLLLESAVEPLLTKATSGLSLGDAAREYLSVEAREEAEHEAMLQAYLDHAGGLRKPARQGSTSLVIKGLVRLYPSTTSRLEAIVGVLAAELFFQSFLRVNSGDSVEPDVSSMCHINFSDETRHIAFARELVRIRTARASTAHLRRAATRVPITVLGIARLRIAAIEDAVADAEIPRRYLDVEAVNERVDRDLEQTRRALIRAGLPDSPRMWRNVGERSRIASVT